MEPSQHASAQGTEQHVKIEVDREHVFLLRKENQKQQLEDRIVRRSKLLTDLLDSKPGQAILPVDAGSLDGWRKYVQIHLTEERGEDVSNVANEEMVMLVKVSEFLLDTETAQQTAKALADELLVNAEMGSTDNKVLSELHPDQQLKVVKASGCSLAHLQSRLVSELQPLALEAFVKEGDKLDLSEELVFRGTPEKPICALPAGLSDMTHLKFLSLANSDAAAGDPQDMSDALSSLISLTHLDLRCNMLQTAACGPLAAALLCMSKLAHLDLSCNVLQLQGLEALCPAISELKKVTFLSLAENSIVAGTSALKTILSSLPVLSQLALDHNAILRSADSTPEVPTDSKEQSSDRPVAEYTPMRALASLKLSNNCLDNSDIDRHVSPLIDACVNITALDLSDNSLSTKAVPAMCNLVASCKTLRSLDVSSCAFSCDEIAEILSAIPDHQPQATEETYAAQFKDSRGPAPLLESLALREMDPFPMEPEEEVDALPTALQRFVHLKSFDISSLELPAHAMEALPIGRMTALTMLDVSMNSVLQQSPLGVQLSSLMALQSLNISSLFLPDDVLLSFAASLCSLTALSVLDMGTNAITSGPACSALSRALASLPSLHTLDMSDNDVLDAESEFVAALPRMSVLKKLRLEQNELHEDSIAPLACALSQLTLLEDLSIAAICAVGPTADVPPALRLCSTLTALTNLTSLAISNNNFRGPRDSALAEILMPLCKLCHLEISCVELPHSHIGCTASTLARMSSLTSLDLSSNTLRLEGAKALAPHLSKMTWLRDLDLSSCMLTPEGLHVIGDSMQQLTALRAIRLDDVVGGGSVPESWSRVFASLTGIPGLRELELRYNRFPSSCIAEHIAPHMSRLTALESLDFQDCGMSREGVKQMLLAMQPLTSIHSLNLGGNRIKDNAANIMLNHPLLEELDLPHAHLKDEEARELLTSIKPLKMLRLVTLTDNYISEAVLNTVGEELPHVLVVFDDVAEIDEVISIDEDGGDEDPLGDEDGEDAGEDDEGGGSDNETGTDYGTYSGSYSDSDTEEYISDEISDEEDG